MISNIIYNILSAFSAEGLFFRWACLYFVPANVLYFYFVCGHVIIVRRQSGNRKWDLPIDPDRMVLSIVTLILVNLHWNYCVPKQLSEFWNRFRAGFAEIIRIKASQLWWVQYEQAHLPQIVNHDIIWWRSNQDAYLNRYLHDEDLIHGFLNKVCMADLCLCDRIMKT